MSYSRSEDPILTTSSVHHTPRCQLLYSTRATLAVTKQGDLFDIAGSATYRGFMDTKKKHASGDYRSEVMRARLMDATLDVIVQEGWAGASTPKICKQAQVSRGAQTHHFPTKTSLFMAAIERVARQYESLLNQRMTSLGEEQKPLRAILEVIWESMLDENYLTSTMEAMVAARTDPELRKPMADLDNMAIDTARSTVVGMAASPESVSRVQDAIELSIYLFRALVVQRGIHDDEKYKRRLFEVWCGFIETALEKDLGAASSA